MEKVSIDFDDQTVKVAQKIASQGGRVYLVGGAVRDLILSEEPHDLDYCVTGLSEAEMLALFPEAKKQGKDFPVFIINGCEYALARTERKTGTKHTDFEVHTDKSLTIEDDLKRRDITINAMAIDVLSKELNDPFGGKEDLQNKVIRKTSEAFIEDPLRAYRVARFAAKMGFSIAPDTIQTLKAMRDSLSSLSVERVFAEFRKALLSNHPEVFFKVLKEAEILDVHFKEIADLIGVEQPVEYHPEGDAFNHTMIVLAEVAKRTPNPQMGSDGELTRFAALVHDLGKALTPREKWPHHYGHEKRGQKPIESLCRRLKMPGTFKKTGIIVSQVHMKLGQYRILKPTTKVKTIEAMSYRCPISFRGIEMVVRVDANDPSISFADIAEKVMDVGATDEMKQALIDKSETGTIDFERLREEVYQRRVEELKRLEGPDNKD